MPKTVDETALSGFINTLQSSLLLSIHYRRLPQLPYSYLVKRYFTVYGEIRG
jgi:hypothetical protein